jgi:hypothetical protein
MDKNINYLNEKVNSLTKSLADLHGQYSQSTVRIAELESLLGTW